MQSAIRLSATVQSGHRIEVATPELAEGTEVGLIIYRLHGTDGDAESYFLSRYPEALNVEYNSLIKAQWQRALTEEKQSRLADIKAEMDAIDSVSEESLLFERQIAKIREQLANIRREAEALPDA